MLTKNVIAADITNLTDARYFAARGVDFLLFDLGQIPLTKILEIKEWVEGPQLLIVFDKETIPLMDESVIKIDPYAIGAKNKEALSEIQFMSAHVKIFDWTELSTIIMEERTFYQLKFKSDLKNLKGSEGIILSGGKEDAVGLKNFETMDEVLDLLEM